jgi:hypothetical protein
LANEKSRNGWSIFLKFIREKKNSDENFFDDEFNLIELYNALIKYKIKFFLNDP